MGQTKFNTSVKSTRLIGRGESVHSCHNMSDRNYIPRWISFHNLQDVLFKVWPKGIGWNWCIGTIMDCDIVGSEK